MESAIERIDATYAYDAPTYSIAIASMSSLSVIFSEVGDPQPSTTTTIGFFTRDPIGYMDGQHLYRCYFVPQRVDPSGLEDWGIPNPFPPAVIPWTEPPSQPITGQCKLKWRCWNIFAGNRHCGLVMSVDGAVTTIDGTGGEENHIDWSPEPYLPGGDGGIQV